MVWLEQNNRREQERKQWLPNAPKTSKSLISDDNNCEGLIRENPAMYVARTLLSRFNTGSCVRAESRAPKAQSLE